MRKLLFTFTSLLLLLLASSPGASQEIVVNASLPFNDVTQTQLRSIFSMRVRSWSNEKPIKVFVLSSDSKLHRDFCLRILEVFPYQLQRIWDVMLFSGTGSTPIEVKDERMMLEQIANNPGSIGYVKSLQGEMRNVKTLQIQSAPY